MDRILLKNMAFFGRHGVLEEEKRLGQRFYVDATAYLDLKAAGEKDDLDSTVHYGMMYECIKNQVENQVYDLIETLGEKICQDLFVRFDRIQKVVIQIRKPSAPVVGLFDYMAVELERERSK